MLGADLVSEMVARKDRGAEIKQIAGELGGGSQDRQALVEAGGVAAAANATPGAPA
jgi:hypothetical protein